MNIIHALQPLPQTIFLAGPTPRSKDVPSWRPAACQILADLGFQGSVLVPEQLGAWVQTEYDNQIFWEWNGLARASVVVFWIPRELQNMPAFTTNVEFGLMIANQKCVLGYPTDAPKMAYLKALATRYNTPVFHTLEDTLKHAVSLP